MKRVRRQRHASGALSGGKIIAAIKASGIEYVLSVPDIVTSAGLLAPIARDKELQAHPRLQGGRMHRHRLAAYPIATSAP